MHSPFSRRKTRNGEPAQIAEMKDLDLSNLDACCRSKQPSSPRMQVDDPITRKIQRRWSGSPYLGITTPRLRLSSNSQPVRFRVLVRTGATVPPCVSPSWTNNWRSEIRPTRPGPRYSGADGRVSRETVIRRFGQDRLGESPWTATRGREPGASERQPEFFPIASPYADGAHRSTPGTTPGTTPGFTPGTTPAGGARQDLAPL